MKPSRNIFELVKSLNKSEKRYFMMFASLQKGSKIYLKLFKEIDSQHEYDEKAIKEKYKSEKFVNQLSFTKNYLSRLIVRSLISYRSGKSVDSNIHELINASKILYEKGLFRQYFSKLYFTLKFAMLHERFNYCLQIIEFKNGQAQSSGINHDIKGTPFSSDLILKKINNLHHYSSLLNLVIEIYRAGGKVRDEDVIKSIVKIESDPMLKEPSLALSYRAKENFYYIKQLIADLKGDDDLLYENCKERLKIITENPEPFRNLNFNYKNDIISYLLSCYARENDEAKFKYYFSMLDTNTQDKNDEAELFFITSYAGMNWDYLRKNWKDGLKKVRRIKEQFKLYHENIEGDKELLLLYKIIVILMMSGKYSAALDEYNNIINNPHLKMRSDLEWYLMLLNLIIHYELKNYKLLKYLLISTYRNLYKKKKLFKVESVVISFIRKLTDLHSEEQLIPLLLILKKDLYAIKEDNFEKNAFRYFDFIGWLDGKIAMSNE